MTPDYLFKAAGPNKQGPLARVTPDNNAEYTDKELQELVGTADMKVYEMQDGSYLIHDKEAVEKGLPVNYLASQYYTDHNKKHSFGIICGDALLVTKERVRL